MQSEPPWALVDAYFRHHPRYAARHQLESFDRFCEVEIPRVIRSMNPIVVTAGDHRAEVEIGARVRLLPPRRDDDTAEAMYPQDARELGSTYASTLEADVRFKAFVREEDGAYRETENVLFEYHTLGRLPVMLQSARCQLAKKSAADLRSYGECEHDQGGYFVVDGMEKVIISQERVAANQLFTHEPAEPDALLGGIVHCLSSEEGGDVFPKTVRFVVGEDLGVRFGLDVLHKDARVPVATIFRALGVTDDRAICALVHDPRNGEDLAARDDLRALVLNGHADLIAEDDDGALVAARGRDAVLSQEAALRRLSAITRYDDPEYVRLVLARDLFPNLGAGATFSHKARYLGYLVERMLRCARGLDPPIGRDTYLRKRVDTSGVLLRDLFRDTYNRLRNHLRDTLNREYVSDRSAKQADMRGLLSASNLARLLPARLLTQALHRSLKGNWVKNGDVGQKDQAREGIVQDLGRLSYAAYLSHVRRVNTPIDRSIKKTDPHKLDAPQFGMMCPIESPDGGNIGLIKHMASTCEISHELDRAEMLALLRAHGVEDFDVSLGGGGARVFLNNTWVGTHQEPRALQQELVRMRRCGRLHALVSIAYLVTQGEVRVLCDAGRCCRPLLRVDAVIVPRATWDSVAPPTSDAVALHTPNAVCPVEGGYPVEYLDCSETQECYIAMTAAESTPRHTHVELHPCAMLSLYTNTIPFCNHNQAPRNIFSGQQGKQAVGMYSTAFNDRMDTASYVLHYPQRQLVTTRMARYSKGGVLGSGENLIVAIATYTGYNQEDSVILNRTSVERGLFNISVLKTITEREERGRGGEEVVFASPPQLRREGRSIDYSRADWSTLDAEGLPRIGEWIEDGRVVLGKVRSVPSARVDSVLNMDRSADVSLTDRSVVAEKTTSGRVHAVRVQTIPASDTDGEPLRQAKIRLLKFRIPALGDKVASMHGQKGVCGMVLPQETMPFTDDGLVPDMIINPHAFPTRMNLGHLMETLVNKACCHVGTQADGTAFEEPEVERHSDELLRMGFHPHGDELMYNGYTGEQMRTPIFVGPTFYMRLKHMVADKINYRARGKVDQLTRQPTHGRAKGGGLRVGEMETNAILGHGIQSFASESMMERADAHRVHVDGETGDTVWYNEATGNAPCLDPREVRVPYSMDLLQREITAMGVGVRYDL
jgi:DNA-directed RNA polymerase II subunit RPB2